MTIRLARDSLEEDIVCTDLKNLLKLLVVCLS